MKKLSTFFLTLLLLLVTSSAFAVTFDEGTVIQIGEPVTEVQTDQWYALYSMLGGWIYDVNAGAKASKAYWLTDESNLQTGMVANDVKDYLLHLENSNTEGAYYIQYANDTYMYMWNSSNSYAWSWSAQSTEIIVPVEGTDDQFSIHETGGNYCLYTWPNAQYACVSWQTGTVTTEWDESYRYKFYPIEFVEPVIDLPEDNDYEIGDEVSIGRKTCTVVGENLFVNGGFNDGMNGWTAGGYTTAADPDNFDIQTSGGYNDGAYLVASSGGTGNEKTPSQAIAVEVGKWYMFVAYTSGKTPDSGNLRYSALFEMNEDGTAELSHTEGTTSYSNDIITLEWGVDPGETTDEWTQTIDVFEATTDYVGMRMGWSGGSYDGFQLYEVEVVELDEPVVVGATSHECVAEIDDWTIEGNTNGDFHYNDWSTEADASGMVVPFLEYWVGSWEGNLSAATINHYSMYMEPGTYEVSLDVRIFSEAGNEIGEGTTLTVNGESVDIVAAGTADVYGDETEVYGTYTLTCKLEEAGYIEISINIPEGVTYNWISFKNLSVLPVEEEPEIEAETSHECVAEVDHWTIEGNTNGDFHYNDWSTEADASGMVVPFLEYWVGSWEGNLSAATISHETLIMEPGTYDVSLDVRIFSEAGNEIGEGTTLTANGESVDIAAAGTADVYGDETEVYGTYVLTCEVGDDGVLDISLDIPEGAEYNWIAFKNLSVTIAEVIEPEPEAETSHECVAEIDHWTIEGNTNGDFHYNDWSTEADASGMVVPFLEYWVGSWEGNLSAATISHETLIMEPGTYDVSLDVRIFSEAGNEIGEGTTLTANGESVDIAAAGTADVYGDETEVYGTYTLTCEVGDDGVLDISLDIPEGVTYNWIAFKNLSVTLAEEEPEPEVSEVVHECVAEVDHWSIAGNTNGDFHYNDWSVEDDPSGMVVPFLEYWVWSGEGNLSAATISHETLTDLEPGTYEVSLDARIFSEAGNDISAGTTLNANDASVDLWIEGTDGTFGTETEVYGTYTLTCVVDEDGTLDICINIPEGVSYNWIAFKNLTVTYVGEEVVADNSYQFVCTDWSSIDSGRVSDDNISYDEASNTITVNAGTGANNVALSNGLSAPFTTADYTVSSEQNWYVVVASNISTDLDASQLWWMNGKNDGGSYTPDYIVELESGEILIAWDLSATGIDTNLQDDENYLDGWTGFGLTSTTGTSVVSDINFYTWREAVAKYPELETAIATEIENVETAGTELAKEGIYTMSGVRLNKITKSGIYIVDGKKVLVK